MKNQNTRRGDQPGDENRPRPERAKILDDAAEMTCGSRNEAYGDPIVNLSCAGRLKQVLRDYAPEHISPGEMEALDMVCTKLARVMTGKPQRDTYVDGACYFAIAGELAGFNGLLA